MRANPLGQAGSAAARQAGVRSVEVAGMAAYRLELPAANSAIDVIPERGGIVSSVRLGGRELLFMDPTTLADRTANVRGGIPILFPIAGALPGGSYTANGQQYQLPQHGFARRMAWQLADARVAGGRPQVTTRLQSNDETRAEFPWDFEARLKTELFDRKAKLTLTVKNTSSSPMPLQAGFHPYFEVPAAEKGATTVDTRATRAFDNVTKQDGAYAPPDFGGAEVDLHLDDHPTQSTNLRVPGEQPVHLQWKGFHKLVMWTLPGKDFICVEPWTAPIGALATGEGLEHLAPGASATMTFEISV